MAATTWFQRDRYEVAQLDVYSGWAFLWAEMVCWILHRTRKPVILTLHGGNLPLFSRRWPRRFKKLLQKASKVTAPSRYLREHLARYHEDIIVLPNPINLSAYSFRLRRTAGPRLIWIRSFHEIYNPVLAIRVAAQVKSNLGRVQLTMIGPDKGDGSLQRASQEAKRLGLSNQVMIRGPIEKHEISNWMQTADIFLNTTNIDNTPVTVVEALACGLCVVSTNVGGIPFMLDHRQDALLVPPDDPEAMASSVCSLVTEHGLSEKLSLSGRRAAAHYDWSVVLPKWEALLRGLVRYE